MPDQSSPKLRCRPIDETLRYAQQYAGKLAITRITDITSLDKIGLPVFVGIRPDSTGDCVYAGKGMTTQTAKVGAYMEAIEVALANAKNNIVPTKMATFRDVLDCREHPERILDLCPLTGNKIEMDGKLECVEALDLFSSKRFLIPAELAFLSYEQQRVFGWSTNGLSSGNSREEAIIHGIFELLERDITSFYYIDNKADLVPIETFPKPVNQLVSMVENANCHLIVRYIRNQYDMPCFAAALLENGRQDPEWISRGFACHLNKEVAITKAISEAIQCRLCQLHGARKDVFEAHRYYAKFDPDQRAGIYNTYKSQFGDTTNSIPFDEIPDHHMAATDVSECLRSQKAFLRQHGFQYLLVVPFTDPEEPLQVVKVVIPKMENYYPNQQRERVGPRIYHYAAQF